MATLKESGEAWIAAGQAEYGQMLIEADAALAGGATAREASDRVIERMVGELCSVHAEVERLKAMLHPHLRTVHPDDLSGEIEDDLKS